MLSDDIGEHDFSDTQTQGSEEAVSASHKHGGDDGLGDSGQGVAGDSLERWVSEIPGDLPPGFQFPLYPSVV